MDIVPALVIHFGADHFDDVFGHDGTHHAAFLQTFAFDEPGEEAGGPHVASACGVDHLGIHGRNGGDFVAFFDEAGDVVFLVVLML